MPASSRVVGTRASPRPRLNREPGVNPKTVATWRKRATVEGLKAGPSVPRSTGLTEGDEAAAVAFRRHRLLPPDDRLYAPQRYSGGGSGRSFRLEAFEGRGFRVERMGREPLTIDRLSIAVPGGIQSDRLKSKLFKADDDGLLARLCCANRVADRVPLSPDRLSHGLCFGDAACGEAVRNGDTDVEFGDLTVKLSRGQALSQELDAMLPGLARLRR